jgi:hypothetical protein
MWGEIEMIEGIFYFSLGVLFLILVLIIEEYVRKGR